MKAELKQKRKTAQEQALTDHTWTLSFITYRLPKIPVRERKKIYKEIQKLWGMVQPKPVLSNTSQEKQTENP